ncbi:hypothetical protein FGB62_6g04 [Gracilaria domingensis]|nr:hypothetical protein FGB62_6g04 [Gracilaria domingensis]
MYVLIQALLVRGDGVLRAEKPAFGKASNGGTRIDFDAYGAMFCDAYSSVTVLMGRAFGLENARIVVKVVHDAEEGLDCLRDWVRTEEVDSLDRAEAAMGSALEV